MLELIINYGALLAYGALATDLVLQIIHIAQRRSSADVSIPGALVRLSANLIFLTKFILIEDSYLILGQTLFLTLVVTYIICLVRYRKPRKSVFRALFK
jgi:hypothetical protein